MRIIIVRHGEPDYGLDCLTPLGRRQARAAALRLRGEGIEAIFSSPMGRAMETARAASEALQIAPVQVLPFMHELRWGSSDGTPAFADGHPWDIADALARQGWDLTRTDWPEHPYFRSNLVTREAEKVGVQTDAWLEGLGYVREGMFYRCVREDGKQHTIALFCHGGSSTAALARIFNLPFPYLCGTLHQPFTSLTIVRLTSRPGEKALPVMELTGDAAHLREAEQAAD